jgi:hypothetical protein
VQKEEDEPNDREPRISARSLWVNHDSRCQCWVHQHVKGAHITIQLDRNARVGRPVKGKDLRQSLGPILRSGYDVGLGSRICRVDTRSVDRDAAFLCLTGSFSCSRTHGEWRRGHGRAWWVCFSLLCGGTYK